MGGSHSKKYLSEAELSSDETDLHSELFLSSAQSVNPLNMSRMALDIAAESDYRVDAVLRQKSLPNAEDVITLEKVQDIEKELDNYEIVSLVYLLYDTTELALQKLQLLVVSGRNSDLIYKWASSEQYKHKIRWQAKLVEAIAIVQNYKILIDIGFTKEDLKDKYMPHRPETSCFVNKTKKALYLIAEKLSKEQTIQFIHNMDKRLREKEFIARNFGDEYLEMYFLYWEQIHVNIEDVKYIFKTMALDEFYDILSSVIPQEPSSVHLNTNIEIRPPSPKIVKKGKKSNEGRSTTITRDTTYQQSKSMEDYPRIQSGISGMFQEGVSNDINGYLINPDKPGVVLIINQEEFYTELDPQYKFLLHEENSRMKLETRDGTMMDKEKLIDVFKKRGFRIESRDNLPHYELIDTIKDVVTMISFESSLIVCILSHGDNGVVYGANSCKVDVNQIQNIMCKKNKKLRDKPKILILQSCQGKQCQKIEEESTDTDEDDANATDGPSTIPSTADLLTFWATVPGFAAIRNKNNGSWLIQELCNEIEKLSPRYHFLDICTRVVEKVTSREWKEKTGTNVMTPMVVTTLRKPFYLPAPKNNY